MYYQQTLIIPKPRQRLEYGGRPSGHTDRRRPETRNLPNRDLNTILAFFD